MPQTIPMVLSMTGYGSAEAVYGDKEIRIEIKAINSKTGDARFRMPNRYSAVELTLRRKILDHAHRGKFEINITTQQGEFDDEYELNLPLFNSYYKRLTSSIKELGGDDPSLAAGILRIYNVVKPNTSQIDDEEEQAIYTCLKESLDRLKEHRREEGLITEKDFELRCLSILNKIKELEPFEEERTKQVRERLNRAFENATKDIEIDKNRFEQELIFYLEKLDITEEKVRLEQHCNYFLKTLKDKQEIKGKSLAFISQEMGREINTLGSKANNHQIQHIVIQMKEELEKIKEQVANVI